MKKEARWIVPLGALLILAITATMFLAPVALAEGDTGKVSVNINTADLEELASLPGIGATKAAAIIDFRSKHGPFSKVEDLTRIQGIGNIILEKIRALISTR